LTAGVGGGIGRAVENRHLIAYGLIAAVLLIGSIVGTVAWKRRVARRRRLRGIKDYNSGGR
jgi:hypothetical protein